MTSNNVRRATIQHYELLLQQIMTFLGVALLVFTGCNVADNDEPLKLAAELDETDISCVRFIGDSNSFVSYGSSSDFKSRKFRVWELGQTNPVSSFSGLARDFVVSLDGSTLYGINGQYRIESWDLNAGRSLGLYDDNPGVEFHSIAMSDDGTFLVAGSGLWRPESEEDNICDVWLWDLRESAAPIRFQGHLGPITGVALSPDNKTVLSSSADGTFRRWNIESKQETEREGILATRSRSLASAPKSTPITFSSDGAMVLHNLDVWDFQRWEKLRTLRNKIPTSDRRHGFDVVTDATFFPETKFLLTTQQDGMLRLWNAETGSLLDSVEASQNRSQATTVAIASNGVDVVSGAVGSIPGWPALREGVPQADPHCLREWKLRLPSPVAEAP